MTVKIVTQILLHDICNILNAEFRGENMRLGKDELVGVKTNTV